MEKALSRFHTCTELLKVFAETVKNQAISACTDTQTDRQTDRQRSCRAEPAPYTRDAVSKSIPFIRASQLPPSLQLSKLTYF